MEITVIVILALFSYTIILRTDKVIKYDNGAITIIEKLFRLKFPLANLTYSSIPFTM